jgi:hypothetical protein
MLATLTPSEVPPQGLGPSEPVPVGVWARRLTSRPRPPYVRLNRWAVGDPIAFRGSATDAEQGSLPGSALRWSVVMHHCPSTCHTHAVQDFDGVASGSLAAPDHEYPSYLELRLTATDAGGLQDVETIRLDPKTVALQFRSAPSGLTLAIDTATGTTPFSRTVIQGSAVSIGAPPTQTLGGTTYTFASWSDGGAATHTITAGAAGTYTATYSGGP